jgi:aspartate-semialdehyde dehydrogenase
MLKVLKERRFPVSELVPVASERSVGKTLEYDGKQYTILSMEAGVAAKADVALFSAGGSVSLEWAPRYAAAGTTVIDNSSAWRMDENVKLIVPEVNGQELSGKEGIIANPNCSTIQMMVVLAPIQKKYGLKRVVVSTYQSITGTGAAAVLQMENERSGIKGPMAYHYPIDRNVIPHCDVFLDNGYTKEEMKLVLESRKILGLPNLRVTATAVRVPSTGGHSESVNLEFERPFELSELRKLLHDSPGIVLQDQPETLSYPMPLYANGKDEVFVGRIRRDESLDNGVNLWIVADNLRKGAATNAVQIAERLLELRN